MVYMLTFTISIPPVMLAYIPYIDPMGMMHGYYAIVISIVNIFL